MICLFLTTSFLILNIKPGHLDGHPTTIRTSTQIGPTLMDGAHEMIDERPDLATFEDVTDLRHAIERFPEKFEMKDQIDDVTAMMAADSDPVVGPFPPKKPMGFDGELPEYNFWINLMAMVCLGVTVLNMFFEAQIVINMCLEFTDDDEEAFKISSQVLHSQQQNSMGQNSQSKAIQEDRSKRFEELAKQERQNMRRADLSKDVEDDCSLCGCLTSCGENIVALFDLEKLLYPLFFNHYRNLRRERLL